MQRRKRCDLEFRIAKLKVKPGDMLVAKIADRVSDDVWKRLQGMFKGVLPEGVRVLVLDQGLDLAVLTFDEIERRSKA